MGIGNPGCLCGINTIEFNYNNNKTITVTKANHIPEIIFENIEDSRETKEFINTINVIYENFYSIKRNNMMPINCALEAILQNISNEKEIKEKMNSFKKTIDEFYYNKYEINEIKEMVEIFKIIYDKKDKINKGKLIALIETIDSVLLESSGKNFDIHHINFLKKQLYSIFNIPHLEENFNDNNYNNNEDNKLFEEKMG